MKSGIGLGIFDLVGVIMLVLAGASFGYLARVRNKSRPSQMLLCFFLCVCLSAIATILTNIGASWDWAFAPSQDALLILAGWFLVRLAYSYPEIGPRREARWMIGLYTILAATALTYALSFAVRYIANLPGDLDENQAFYLLTPAAILFVTLVFFRRSAYCSALPSATGDNTPGSKSSALQRLRRPASRPARALRNYGLALMISLLPVIVTLLQPLLPGVMATFLFNFGGVLAITVLMLVYLNDAPEPVTILAKLVGIALVSVLLTLGLAGIWIDLVTGEYYEHQVILVFITLVLISSTLMLVIFPFFYRLALLNPLNRLIKFMKIANAGNLDIQAAVQYEDEIGYLTHSFNSMVRSLRALTDRLEDRTSLLEVEVEQRTSELSQANAALEQENLIRKETEARLSQQLLYQAALAGCSQALLATADDEASQEQILNQALKHLLQGARASRAYLIRILDEEVMDLMIESCAPGIRQLIANPINHRFPVAHFPARLVEEIGRGKPVGGPTRRIMASTPEIRDLLLAQTNPLLSFILFPILSNGRCWGMVGFDDCTAEREWSSWEFSLLGTASEMIDSTLQRWEAQRRLKESLDQLEQRVEQRTVELSQTNLRLSQEIQQRQRIQDDLETRLRIEKQLAAIAARLQEPANIQANIGISLAELAKIVGAGRILLVMFDGSASNQVSDTVEWRRADLPELPREALNERMRAWSAFPDRAITGNMAIIHEPARYPLDFDVDPRSGQAGETGAVVLLPLVIDDKLHAVLVCSQLQTSVQTMQTKLQALELAAGMYQNLLQREYLIQRLEEQVAERTHQLAAFLDMAMLNDQAQELTDVLQPILHSIAQIIACDACGIYVFDETQSSLRLVAERGIPSGFQQTFGEFRIDARFASWLEETGTERIPGSQEYGLSLPEAFCIPEYRSFVTSRLTAGSKLLGLLICYTLAPRPFSVFQENLLAAFGNLLGIIVENQRLRNEAEALAALEERQRLAREIHDAISQSVYSLSLFARSAQDALDEGDQENLAAYLLDLETTALQAMREMRLLIYQLRDTGQENDLATALDTRFKQVENRLGIQTRRELQDGLTLPAQAQHEVWRVIIEALNNVVKHANATQVVVQVSCSDDNLEITIQDDGAGFVGLESSPGMGIKNMRQRAESLRGQLEIVSLPEQGTRVTLRTPLADLDLE